MAQQVVQSFQFQQAVQQAVQQAAVAHIDLGRLDQPFAQIAAPRAQAAHQLKVYQ
jgi:hypothetical protein